MSPSERRVSLYFGCYQLVIEGELGGDEFHDRGPQLNNSSGNALNTRIHPKYTFVLSFSGGPFNCCVYGQVYSILAKTAKLRRGEPNAQSWCLFVQ